MKKILLFTSVFLLFAEVLSAQIPNFSFEDWISNGSYEVPQFWGTLNDYSSPLNVFTATKGTPGNPGNSYLKLTSKALPSKVVLPGFAVSGTIDQQTLNPLTGFAFNQRPQKLTGKWQYMAYGPEAGFIAIYLTKWNPVLAQKDTIASKIYPLPGMVMSWATFNLNLNYQSGDYPDTALIILSSSGPTPYVNSYLYVDNLTFAGTVAGIEENPNSKRLELSSNPVAGDIVFRCNTAGLAGAVITLMDITGKVVATINRTDINPDGINRFITSNLNKGIYFIQLKSANYTEVKKLVLL